jgi:hypothetical protein
MMIESGRRKLFKITQQKRPGQRIAGAFLLLNYNFARGLALSPALSQAREYATRQ